MDPEPEENSLKVGQGTLARQVRRRWAGRCELAANDMRRHPLRIASCTFSEDTPHLRTWRKSGLTRRECEVLLWLLEGKRNSEIAIILGAQPRTIGKHLENIFAKLGVETRGGAAAEGRRMLDGSGVVPPAPSSP